MIGILYWTFRDWAEKTEKNSLIKSANQAYFENIFQ